MTRFKVETESITEMAERLGYSGFGPAVTHFLTWLGVEAPKHSVKKLYFLSREGYFLQSLFEKCLSLGLAKLDNVELRYFHVSRRAVFGATPMTRELLRAIVFAGAFEGRMHDMLDVRIGLPVSFSEKIGIENREIVLPEGGNEVVDYLVGFIEQFNERAAQERPALMAYLKQEGFLDEEPVGLVDLGYAGSIQRFLGELSGQSLVGFYFATAETVHGWENERNKTLACFATDCGPAKMPAVYRYGLAFESWMTSPEGQVVDFEIKDGKALPRFAAVGKMQSMFDIPCAVAKGVEKYMEDISFLAKFDPLFDETLGSLAQIILAVALESRQFAPVFKALSVEDAFTGSGEIVIAESIESLTKELRLADAKSED